MRRVVHYWRLGGLLLLAFWAGGIASLHLLPCESVSHDWLTRLFWMAVSPQEVSAQAGCTSPVQALLWRRGRYPDTLLSITTTTASGAGVISAVFTTDAPGYQTLGCAATIPAWSGTPAATGQLDLWLCREVDGSTYEDCDTTNFAPREPDASFAFRGANVAQRVAARVVLPPGTFKALARNTGTGVSFTGSAGTPWTVICRALTTAWPD